MLESLKRKGIEIRLNAYALSVYDTADGITLTYTDNSDNTPYFWEGDALLLATGRRPMTDGLNLHAAGIRTDTRGALIVNEHLQTTAPHIWAMGDVEAEPCMTIYPWMISALSPTGCSAIKSEKPMTGFRFHMSFFYRSAVGGMTEEEAVKRGYSLQVSPVAGCRHTACPYLAADRRYDESHCQRTYGTHNRLHPVFVSMRPEGSLL